MVLTNSVILLEINVRENQGAIKNGQSRETGNIGYKTQDEDKENKNTTQSAVACQIYT